jgi:amino acid transporter
VWIGRAFGSRAGAYGAWVLIVANVFAVLATALPAGTYSLDLVAPQWSGNEIAVALAGSAWTAATALLLWYGLRPTAALAGVLLVIELLVLGSAAGIATAHPRVDAVAFTSGPPAWGGLISAIVVGIWMIDGWEVSASTAEEALGDASVPGSGGLLGLLVTSVVLLAAVLAFSRVGSLRGYDAHQSDALAYVGGLLGGAWPVVLAATVLVSLAASLQTTLVYLSRSFYAMGRDGLLPAALGRLDVRDEPAAAVALIAGLSIGLTLAAGLIPKAHDAFDIALQGTSWFLGVLFAFSAAAAVRIFAGDPSKRWTGVLLPGTAALALAAILAVAFVREDAAPRVFIAASAIIGLPLAVWRGRARRSVTEPGAGTTVGSRF